MALRRLWAGCSNSPYEEAHHRYTSAGEPEGVCGGFAVSVTMHMQ
jgi:hypothetical protein